MSLRARGSSETLAARPPMALADNRGFRGHELTDINKIVSTISSSSWRSGMSTLVERAEALAVDVSCSGDQLSVVLSDGRTVTVPLVWFPRLVGASEKQRADWELIGGGVGIHWEAVDEDISVASSLQPENFMRLPNPYQPSPRQGRRSSPSGRRRKSKRDR